MFNRLNKFERTWVRILVGVYLGCILGAALCENWCAVAIVCFIAIVECVAMVQSYQRVYGAIFEKPYCPVKENKEEDMYNETEEVYLDDEGKCPESDEKIVNEYNPCCEYNNKVED